MDLMISKQMCNGYAIYEVTDGKKSVRVTIRPESTILPRLNVCVQNASHRVWRGHGRDFDNFTDATNAYKMQMVKSGLGIIRAEHEFDKELL